MKRLGRMLAALCAAGVTVAANAHAMLERADPRVGSVVRSAPGELRLWFSEPLEAAFSRVEVRDAGGERVDTGQARVDSKDPRQLHVPLAPLAPGDYRVAWRAVSVDTHVSNGDFHFRVAP